MSAGGHRGKFILTDENKPAIKFSLPRIPRVTGSFTRYQVGESGPSEDFLAAYFIPDSTEEPMIDFPEGCKFEWDSHDPTEPLIHIPLVEASDIAGVFITDQAYPDIGVQVNSRYCISYLPGTEEGSGDPKTVSIPEYGFALSWQNHTNEDAYLAIIAGYEFDPVTMFDLETGQRLAPVSTRFYYAVIATPSAPDPHAAMGIIEWDPAKLTIDLDLAGASLRLPTDADRTPWDFYREDIREGPEAPQPSSRLIRVETVPGNPWNSAGPKNLFTIDAMDGTQYVSLVLGQYLLLTAETEETVAA